MFKSFPTIPDGVDIERYFDVREIDNNDSSVSFFTSNPNGSDTDNNYTQNPFTQNRFHVILGITLDPLTKAIRQTADIDPFYVVNNLNDGTLVLSTGEGRVQDLIHPIKDYLNFNGLGVASVRDNSASGSEEYFDRITLGSTGVRKPDNLFYLSPNEGFKLEAKFNSGTWPTTANWTSAGVGRFGIKAEMYVAKMDEAQFEQYKAMLNG